MRKIMILFLIAGTLLIMLGCSMTRCDICNDLGADNELRAITTWHLCDDCYEDFDDVDYDDDDYDEKSYSTSQNSCYDCGKSIDSDSLYCDKCLGYGTCQDCGKSIDSDSLYCDKCLGYGTCQDCGKNIDSDSLYCDKCLGYGTCQDCGKSIADNRLYCNNCLYD